jgi:hypothetical protein
MEKNWKNTTLIWLIVCIEESLSFSFEVNWVRIGRVIDVAS